VRICMTRDGFGWEKGKDCCVVLGGKEKIFKSERGVRFVLREGGELCTDCVAGAAR
jgi:hypothetical protein